MHQRLVSCQILRCIDAVRHQIEKHYMDLVAMRQDTRHINRLGFLQRCRLKTRILVKKISLNMNNANLLVKHHLHRAVLNKRNRFTKKQGGIELSVDHDLDTVKIIGLLDGVDVRGQLRNKNIFIIDQKRRRPTKHAGDNRYFTGQAELSIQKLRRIGSTFTRSTPYHDNAVAFTVVPVSGNWGQCNIPLSTVDGSSKKSRNHGMYSRSAQAGRAKHCCT